MIHVVIADDHPLVRVGVKNILKKGKLDVAISGEASNGEELMQQLEKKVPDIVILDIAMPGKSGMEILKLITKNYKGLPVLMLSMHPEERFAVRSIKEGAYGYLNKDSIPEKLVRAVDTIVNNQKRYISVEVAEQLAVDIDSNNPKAPHEKLSDREFEVMCMIASGKQIKEIAKDLSLSVQTIHTYRSRVMDKMKLTSNMAITRYVITHQLLVEP